MTEAAVTISFSTLFFVLVGAVNLIVLGPMAWIVRSAIRDIRDQQNAHNLLRQELPIEYVRREHYAQDIAEIKTMLTSITNKLDKKADKEKAHD